MYKKVLIILLAINVMLFTGFDVYAEDIQGDGVATEIENSDDNELIMEDDQVADEDIDVELSEGTESLENDVLSDNIGDEASSVGVETDDVAIEEYEVDASLELSANYPMIMDKVEGSNIETFYIARPDPEALKSNMVNASTFGLSTASEDNYKAFSDALTYCKNNPNTYLVIDKGVYYFKTNASLELKGLRNVLIEGNGSEFIFESQKQFTVEECDGVELRNLIVDWNWKKDRVASLVEIQNKTDHSFEIKFLELDDVDENIPLVSFQQYDSKDHIPGTYGSWKTFNPVEVPGSITSVEKIEPNVLRLEISPSFTTSFHNEEVYILRHYTYGGSVFNVSGGSSNITFDNVRIYGSAGMGFVFGSKANHFQLINSYIGLRPGSEDKTRMATSADGIHILNTSGYFRIDNCDLSYTGDDIMNIHDDMLMVTQVNSRNQLLGNVTGGFASKGDKVRIYNTNMEDIGFETEVTGFIRQGDGGTITFADEFPSEVKKGYYVYRSSSSTHNYVISNNYIHETKGRAVLLNAPDGLFENNRVYRTVGECVEVCVDVSDRVDKYWYEGTGSKNIVVKNNTFEECAFGGKGSIVKIDCSIGNSKNVLSDVHIENNEFKYCYGAKTLLSADNISDLYIQNNLISDCGDIVISDYCGAVYNSGNTITYPSKSCPHTDTKQVGDRLAGCYEYGYTGKTYCNLCHTITNSQGAGRPPKHDNIGPGGSCSKCGYGKVASVSWMSLDMNSKDSDYIGVNLYIDATEDTIFYLDGAKVAPLTQESNGLYKLSLHCSPKELADKHTLTAKDIRSNVVNINSQAEYVYSADMYCKYVLSNESNYSAEVKAVCKSLLEYSNQARNYFEYNNTGLVTNDVSASIQASGYEMKTVGQLPGGTAYIGSSLVLKDEVILRHYFTGSSSGLAITCTDTVHKESASVTIGDMNSVSMFYVDIKIPYSDIVDMMELKITTAGGNSYSLSYGVLTYCNKARAMNTNSKLINLCNALYNYSAAVMNYKKSV